MAGLACALQVLGGPALAQSGAGGPAELPPAAFSGRQYVDSRGCVFLRAEPGGAGAWVPRLARDGTPLCGFRPSQPAGAAPAPELSLDPGLTIPPVPDHPPRAAAQAEVPAASDDAPLPETAESDAAPMPVPETAEAPAAAAPSAAIPAAPEPVQPAPQPDPNGLRFVQVATLGSRANIERSLALVAELGLPVRQEVVRARGRELTVILAGPFDDRGTLLEARRNLRRLGFTDAFLRK